MMKLLESYCQKWDLQEPTRIASTFTSDVFKVKWQESEAVLKIFKEKGFEFEVKGSAVLRCFNGQGAVKLFKSDDGAHLLEYADGLPLRSLVVDGKDAQATEIICDLVIQMHNYAGPIPDGLINLERQFRSLFLKASTEPLNSLFVEAARVAERLLETEQEVRVLHGDIHHENILASSARGWLAIDTQSLAGERTYDVANTFSNPDGFLSFVEATETIERRSRQISDRLKLDRRRVLEFAFAHGCLSAAWSLEDGRDGTDSLRIAARIRDVLNRKF